VIKDNPELQSMAHITIEQVSGAAATEVTITARRNGNVHGLVRNVTDYEPRTITWHDTAPGTTNALTAYLEYQHVEPVNVVLDFTSVQAGTGQTWQQTLTAVPRRPDPDPRPAGRRGWAFE
jgi:hypothetical protein